MAYFGVSVARNVEPDDKAKREEFLTLVTFGIQAMMQDAYNRPHLGPEGKALVLSRHILDMSIAFSAADKIPQEASATSAALDVLDHVFGGIYFLEDDPDRSWLVEIREGRSRKYRSAWAGYEPHSVVRKVITQSTIVEEMRIDGKMRAVRPEWHGLPFSSSIALEAASWVRSEEKIYEQQLLKQLDEIDPEALKRSLKRLEKDGWLKCDREPDRAVTYEATYKLTATLPFDMRKARLPKPRFATPTERYHARTRAARVDWIGDIHKAPDARKILEAIRRLGPMQLKEIGPLVPQMKRLALRAFMMELREGGWVKCVGRGGGAAWTATEKLLNSKIR